MFVTPETLPGAPFSIAGVDAAQLIGAPHADLHVHDDHDEIYLCVTPGCRFTVELDDDRIELTSPASVLIPAGKHHRLSCTRSRPTRARSSASCSGRRSRAPRAWEDRGSVAGRDHRHGQHRHDLLLKVQRSPWLECALFVGRNLDVGRDAHRARARRARQRPLDRRDRRLAGRSSTSSSTRPPRSTRAPLGVL